MVERGKLSESHSRLGGAHRRLGKEKDVHAAVSKQNKTKQNKKPKTKDNCIHLAGGPRFALVPTDTEWNSDLTNRFQVRHRLLIGS